MAGFRYRLAILLDRKEDERKEAQAEVARREQELQAELARLAELEQRERELVELRERMRHELLTAAVLSGAEALTHAEFIKRLASDIEAARNDIFSQGIVVEEHQGRVAQAQARAEEAKREVEVLTKHRARQQERYFRDLAAREELELDEVGNVLYTRRRTEG